MRMIRLKEMNDKQGLKARRRYIHLCHKKGDTDRRRSVCVVVVLIV